MATYHSNLSKAYLNKARVRSVTHRGSLLVSHAKITDQWLATAANNVVYVGLIPFISSLEEVKIVTTAAAAAATTVTLGIAGINRNQSLTNILDLQVLSISAAAQTSVFTTPLLWTQTIYQYLMNNAADAFQDYKKERYGMLYLKNMTVQENIGTTYVSYDYVEGTPSDASLMSDSDLNSITDKKVE